MTSPTSSSTSVGTTAAGWSGTTLTDARIESTSRSSRSTWAIVPSCQLARRSRRSWIARGAAVERRLLGQQVGVGADDRQRRPELVGHEGDELGSRLVDRLELGGPLLGLLLLAPLLDDPGEEVRDRPELGDIGVAELALAFRLDVEHADRPVVPGQRHRQHRGDESALVDAPDPQEPRVVLDVADDDRLAALGDAAGHALAERHAGAADLESVEAVRRREGQVGSVPVEEVERRDLPVERVPGLVDDRLEELIPGLCRGRQARDAMEEAELLELPRPGHLDHVGVGHRDHDTKVRSAVGSIGCGGGERTLRLGTEPQPPGGRMTRSDPLATEIGRLWRLLGDVVEEQAGPDVRRLVERTRRRAVRARAGDAAARRAIEHELDGLGRRARRGRHPGVPPPLPAGEPGRGAAPRPGPRGARPALPTGSHGRHARRRHPGPPRRGPLPGRSGQAAEALSTACGSTPS